MLRPGYTFMNKWVLGPKLGEGGCAEVFSVTDKTGASSTDLVIKCATIPTGKGKAYKERLRIVNTLYYENMLHKGVLLGFKYAPMIPKNGYGDEKGYRFLVMQQLDFDLKTLAERGTSITGQVLCSIGTQILEGLEIIHKKGYVYVDVKPDNFMILKAQRGGSVSVTPQDRLYFIDFGLMEKYTEYMSGGAQRAASDRGGIAGTPNYASLDVHAGVSPACKDDIESLGYVLLAIASRGRLPWFCATSDAEGLAMKRSANILQLATSCGYPQIAHWILQARDIPYADTPNYETFRAILQQIASVGGVDTAAKNKKVSSANSAPLANIDGTKSKKRKGLSLSDASQEVENVVNVEKAIEVAPTRGRKTKTVPKKTTEREVIDIEEDLPPDNLMKRKISTESKPQAKQKKVTSKASIPTAPLVIDSDESEEEEGSPTPKKEPRNKKPITPAGPFTASLPTSAAPTSPLPMRRSQRLSTSPANTKKSQSITPAIVLKDTATNLTVAVTTDHAILLGRDDNAAMCIDDGYVSESHAHVQAIAGKDAKLHLRVMDLKSSNGTKVNGKKITPKRWYTAEIGDVITLGLTNLMVDCQAVDV